MNFNGKSIPDVMMFDITKTISHFESLQKRYTTQHNNRMCQKVYDALQALYFCRDYLYPHGDIKIKQKEFNTLSERCRRIREIDKIELALSDERCRLYHDGLTSEQHNKLFSMVESDGEPHMV